MTYDQRRFCNGFQSRAGKFFSNSGGAIKRKHRRIAMISIHGAQKRLTGHTTKQFQKETEFWQKSWAEIFQKKSKQ